MMYSPYTVVSLPRPWPAQERNRILEQMNAQVNYQMEEEWRRRKIAIDLEWQQKLEAERERRKNEAIRERDDCLKQRAQIEAELSRIRCAS